MVLPAVFALVCLGLLVFATRNGTSRRLGVVLAGAGVAVAIARTGLSFRAVRSLAEHRREARTDELTGLANRRAFNELLERALAAPAVTTDAWRCSSWTSTTSRRSTTRSGHHYGDELLRLTAPRLQQAVRAGDVVARIGGDEFAVLLADADGTLAVRIAERLRAGFRRPFLLGARSLVIAPSVGIALVPDDGREPVELLQHADLAMYEAKATRSGHALFSSELHPSGRTPAGDHRAAAAGDPGRRGGRPLPAAGLPADRRGDGRRGAGPLEAPGRRPACRRAGSSTRPRAAGSCRC